MPDRLDKYSDLENGDPSLEAQPNNQLDDRDLDEYAALVRYISTYRDPGKEHVGKEDADNRKVLWYAPWRRLSKRKENGSAFVVPDEWVTTDIKTGLSSSEVDSRRAKTGWNEITTETENLFLKFLSYFTGPILYGVTCSWETC
jgi:H+-transporting ATPase